MKLLPKNQLEVKPNTDEVHTIAPFSEYSEGSCRWPKCPLSDFPNSLASLDDLKRFSVNSINRETC